MNTGTAWAIFMQINSREFTDAEKEDAILEILKMPTHMSITKSNLLDVIKYLLPLAFKFSDKNIENNWTFPFNGQNDNVVTLRVDGATYEQFESMKTEGFDYQPGVFITHDYEHEVQAQIEQIEVIAQKSLTLDELEQRIGKPVYIVYPDAPKDNRWEIVREVERGIDSVDGSYDELVWWTDDEYDNAQFIGEVWNAYDSEPVGAGNKE